jgi:hypothetical protein
LACWPFITHSLSSTLPPATSRWFTPLLCSGRPHWSILLPPISRGSGGRAVFKIKGLPSAVEAEVFSREEPRDFTIVCGYEVVATSIVPVQMSCSHLTNLQSKDEIASL